MQDTGRRRQLTTLKMISRLHGLWCAHKHLNLKQDSNYYIIVSISFKSLYGMSCNFLRALNEILSTFVSLILSAIKFICRWTDFCTYRYLRSVFSLELFSFNVCQYIWQCECNYHSAVLGASQISQSNGKNQGVHSFSPHPLSTAISPCGKLPPCLDPHQWYWYEPGESPSTSKVLRLSLGN